MLTDYLCPINSVSLRSASSRFLDDIPRMPPLRLLQSVILVTNDIAETTVSAAPHTFPALSALAANACANRISEVNAFSLPDDILRVARFIGDNSELPRVVQHALREAFYQRWKSLPIREHTWLAEAVAIERVSAGHSCKTVALAHGISRDGALMRQLNMLAVDGPAGARVFAGECCYAVAEAHGIELDSFAFNALQKCAVLGRAGARVRNGEPCSQVAEDHGICLQYEAMDMLEMIAVNSCAGERVRNGESCRLVAREHGISPLFMAMHHLEMIAVETFGAQRVRNGECSALVAQSLGISLAGDAVKVLVGFETATGGVAKRPRLL